MSFSLATTATEVLLATHPPTIIFYCSFVTKTIQLSLHITLELLHTYTETLENSLLNFLNIPKRSVCNLSGLLMHVCQNS